MSHATLQKLKGRADESDVIRTQIAALHKELQKIYQKTNSERARLSAEKSPHEGGSIHGEIELFVADVCGYADSITRRGAVRNPFQAMRWLIVTHGAGIIARLRQMPHSYPKLAHYVGTADHLRRLAEYIERYSQ